MKKTLTIILLIFLQTTYCQKSNEINDSVIQNFTGTFLKHISKSEFDKAYLMLGEEQAKRETSNNFKLYFSNIIKYYGDIKNYKCEIENGICFNKDDDTYIGSYQIEFTDTEAKFILTVKINDNKKPEINYYLLIHDNNQKLETLDQLLKKPLIYLKKGDYKSLYNLIPRSYQFDTYDEFLTKIKKLESDAQMRLEQVRHEILVFNSIVNLTTVYDVNEIGEIIFVIDKKGGQDQLSGISFNFTKEIEEKYKADLAKFIDSTRIRRKKVLSSQDSIQLKKEFDKKLQDKENAEIAKLIEESKSIKTNENSPSIGLAYDWNQINDKKQKLIKDASNEYLGKLVNNDIDGFWKICHSKFKASMALINFKDIISPIADIVNSKNNLKFVDGKMVNYSIPPKKSQLTTSGSLDKSKPTYLQYYSFPDIENQALTIYKFKEEKLSRNITMRFGLEDSKYKLIAFDINLSSINEKDANYYYKLSKKWESNLSSLPKFIALNMAYRLSYLGNGISTGNMIDIKIELNNLKEDPNLFKELEKWNINNTVFNIINFDFLETKNDITLNLKYISHTKLEKKLIEEETEKLFKYFKDKYPDIVKEFKRFMFTAYKEYPSIPFKEYEYYRVIKK